MACIPVTSSPVLDHWSPFQDGPMSVQAAARRMDGGGVARQGHKCVSIFPHVRPSEAPRCPQEEVWAPESPAAAHRPGFSVTLPFALNMPLSASSVWKALSSKLPHLFVYSYLSFTTQFIYNFLGKNLLWPSYLLSLSPNQVKPPTCVLPWRHLFPLHGEEVIVNPRNLFSLPSCEPQEQWWNLFCSLSYPQRHSQVFAFMVDTQKILAEWWWQTSVPVCVLSPSVLKVSHFNGNLTNILIFKTGIMIPTL